MFSYTFTPDDDSHVSKEVPAYTKIFCFYDTNSCLNCTNLVILFSTTTVQSTWLLSDHSE